MEGKKGTLFVVSTPIGNLQDVTLRAIKILIEADFIACEDTRRTGILLKSIKPVYEKLYGAIGKKREFISYYEQNELKRIPQILNALINGFDVALVSDAGTPAISDPGFKLIRECIINDIKVSPVPGPSSVIAAVSVSGLPTDKFLFVGYPPAKGGKRTKFLEKLSSLRDNLKTTIVLFEAPHRILQTLTELKEIAGDIDIVITRELTKVFEETKRGKVSDIIKEFEKSPPKGEIVLLFN